VLRPADVDRSRFLRLALGPVDVGPCSRVQRQIDCTERRRRLGDVPLTSRQRDDLVRGELLDERSAELAAGAGYDDASRADRTGDVVLQRCLTRSSSQGMPCSSGSVGSYSCVTRYAKSASVSAS
jgi:hypothetical protein